MTRSKSTVVSGCLQVRPHVTLPNKSRIDPELVEMLDLAHTRTGIRIARKNIREDLARQSRVCLALKPLDGDRFDLFIFGGREHLTEQIEGLRVGDLIEARIIPERVWHRSWIGRDGDERTTIMYVARTFIVKAEAAA